MNVNADVKTSSQDFVPVVIAPVFNNEGTVVDILNRIANLRLPVIVVNDGCTDATPELVDRWSADLDEGEAFLAYHAVNRGKAAALRTGFGMAAQQAFTHAVTIDTDGQLDPEQIPSLLKAARNAPRSLVLGFRDEFAPDYPSKSRIGRNFSNVAIRLECGEKVRDSQCGLRVYPLELVKNVACSSGRFGYETEIITRAAWAGFGVVELPVNCRYFSGEKRVTHFKVFRDTFRHFLLHARLLARTAWPGAHRRVVEQKEPSGLVIELRNVAQWASPLELWRQIRNQSADRSAFATGLAIGVFISNLPLYGLHTLLSLYMARKLHLHPLPVVVGSYFSTPPVGPILIAGSIWLGHLVIYHSSLSLTDFSLSTSHLTSLSGRLLLEWSVGGIMLGLAFATLAFFGSTVVLKLVPGSTKPRKHLQAAKDNPTA